MRQKINDWKRKYKLTEEAYNKMLSVQENKCCTCLEIFTETPHVDHCHKTEKVRGLLCGNCNRALGSINDNIPVLENMIKYLRDNNETN